MLPVLIKTYARDAEWLYWLLRSADRFAGGFGPWYVVTEPESMDAIRRTILRGARSRSFGVALRVFDSHDALPEGRVVLEGVGNRGYIHQQYCKLHGDLIVGGDHLQIDSDCFLVRETTPTDWGAPPYWFKTPFASLVGSQALAWRDVTNAILGFTPAACHHVALGQLVPVEHEYMRRHPFYMRAEGLRGLRAHLERQHSKSIAELFRGLDHVSEYNLYGAWCERFAPELHRWIDTSSVPPDQWPPVVALQGWSYAGHRAGIPPDTLARYHALLGE